MKTAIFIFMALSTLIACEEVVQRSAPPEGPVSLMIGDTNTASIKELNSVFTPVRFIYGEIPYSGTYGVLGQYWEDDSIDIDLNRDGMDDFRIYGVPIYTHPGSGWNDKIESTKNYLWSLGIGGICYDHDEGYEILPISQNSKILCDYVDTTIGHWPYEIFHMRYIRPHYLKYGDLISSSDSNWKTREDCLTIKSGEKGVYFMNVMSGYCNTQIETFNIYPFSGENTVTPDPIPEYIGLLVKTGETITIGWLKLGYCPGSYSNELVLQEIGTIDSNFTSQVIY